MTTYYEKLKDPRWQRVRLRVMDRSDFACERCQSKTKTLNVHHKIYRKGADPWDYDEHVELECLCEDCHKRQHDLSERLNQALLLVDLERVLGYAEALFARQTNGPFEPAHVWPTGYDYIEGVADATRGDVDEIVDGIAAQKDTKKLDVNPLFDAGEIAQRGRNG